MTEPYVHLHVHSEYSLLDGLSDPLDLIKNAKEKGMPAIALTDHGTMYGAIEFYKAAKEEGIKPIVGVEAYLAPRNIEDRGPEDRHSHHITLLAKDLVGYRNLLYITTRAHIDGFYYKPRIDHSILEGHTDGLIALSGCASGEVPYAIRKENPEKARELAKWYLDLFGKDNFYIELMDHGIDFQLPINREILTIAKELDLQVVATNDSHYTRDGEHTAQDILLCVQTGSKLDDPDRFRIYTDEHYLKTGEEMDHLFAERHDSIVNTMAVAEKCNLEIPFGRLNFPKLPFVPDDESPDTFLAKLCWKGIYKKYGVVKDDVAARLRYELGVIETTGFAPYMLFVWDFVRFARERNIMCGPRGSAAGSIVLYCLGITTIDPIAHSLTFERFLNPERIQMPDIDMDFADSRREEVIQYITDLYGSEHVAQIVTIGKMMAKAAIRDTGRVLDYAIPDVNRVSKLIPTLPIGMTIDKSLEAVPELKEMYENEAYVKTLIDHARSIEGTARHAGVHAAGIVVSGDPLVMHTPLQIGKDRGDKSAKKTVVAQYEMHALEDIGLLKMDFLGLSNLTLLENAVKNIKEQRGIDIDIHNLPAGDPATYEMLSNGDSVGVFQLEGSGMRRTLREFKPTSVHHLAAIVSLYRPGPMAHIPTYISAKDGKTPIVYPHPKLESILSDTYGVIVYQDQVLLIVQAIAGYSLGRADILRKAMGKKIREEMVKEKQNFLDGAKANGVESSVANQIWEYIEPFAGYAFNRAHAYCYAYIAYQTAYLKCNYPIEYMTAMFTTESGNTEKITAAVGESRRLGLTVLAPEINKSKIDFRVESDDGTPKIRYGLNALKGVESAAVAILENRDEKGPFRSLDDFCERIGRKTSNRLVVERLIKAGAFDEFGRREQLMSVLEGKMKAGKKTQAQIAAGQTSIFDLLPADEVASTADKLPNVPIASQDEISAWEKESFGFFLNNHPFEVASQYLDDIITANTSQIKEGLEGEAVTTAGAIISLRKITTRKGLQMAAGRIEDMFGSAEFVVFPRAFKENEDVWKEDNIIIIKGRINRQADSRTELEQVQVVVDSAKRWAGPEDTPAKKPEYRIRDTDSLFVPTNGTPAIETVAQGDSLLEMVRRNLAKEQK